MNGPLAGRDGQVRLEEVRRSFGVPHGATVRALDGVTLEIEAGEMVALTGPSGSGKSTLLHVVAAIEPVDSGRIFVGGAEISAMGRRDLVGYRRTIGLVFQRFHLIGALSALDNVCIPVLPYRVDFEAAARGRDLLGRVGLGGRENSLPARMSGGQQQRVAIARALIGHPKLLLADEPTGSLDRESSDQVLELLIGLCRDLKMTLIIATHDHDVALRCDRRAHIEDGRLVGVD